MRGNTPSTTLGGFFYAHAKGEEMTKVIIDGVEYIPRAEVPEITDERLGRCLRSLTEIQYFSDCPNKHRAWAWDAMNALAPELAQLSSEDPQAAFDRVRPDQES